MLVVYSYAENSANDALRPVDLAALPPDKSLLFCNLYRELCAEKT